MAKRFLAIMLLLAAVTGAAPARAQTPAPAPVAAAPPAVDATAPRLDQARVELEQIEASLGRAGLSDVELQRLRARVDPIVAAIAAVIADAQPRYDAVKSRLDQLGPKPDDKAPPETPGVTAERTEQTRLLGLIDDALRRARLLAVQADQLNAAISSRRRALFTQSLFQRSASILSPSLWYDVAADAPRDARAIGFVFGDWARGVAAQATPGRVAAFIGFLAALGAALPLLRRVSRRVLAFESGESRPSPLRQILGAFWTILVVAGLPIVVTAGAAGVFAELFPAANARLTPFAAAIFEAVVRIAATAGAVRGLLAPERPMWRPIAATDEAAGRLASLAIAVAVTVSATRLVESLIDVTAGAVRTSVAVRGVGAVAVALLVAWTLRRMQAPAAQGEAAAPAGPRDWRGTLRLLAWAVIVLVLGAACVGYVALAAFLVDQALWLTGIGVVVFLLSRMLDKGFERALKPEATLGHALITGIGLRRESLGQLAALGSGLSTLLLFLVAALLALAPWGVESQDMLASIEAAFFGIKVGDATISLSTIVGALALFAIAILATRALQKWLDTRYLPRTQLDIGLRNSIRTSVGYVGFAMASAIALAQLGLSFERLAIVAGALSVGIGFGLQSIVSNFVSGLILLWERAIRVGDWIVVGDEQGFVRRINVRSTEIETFDRATVIMPNSNLVSGVVKNWVRMDRIGRFKIELTVAQNSDRDRVADILKSAAKAHELVLKIPAPSVLLTGYDALALRFELIGFVNDVETAGRVKSDLYFEVLGRFEAEGVSLPQSQRETIIRMG